MIALQLDLLINTGDGNNIMKYRAQGIRIRYNRDSATNLKTRILQTVGLKEKDLISFKVKSRSIDARKKPVSIVYTVDMELPDDYKPKGIIPVSEPKEHKLTFGKEKVAGRIVIAGAGPAGLFAAYFLAQHGYKPLILERGQNIKERTEGINSFIQTRDPDPENNVLFGIGGAGTFSDGKLTTSLKHPLTRFILKTLVECGAPKEIMTDTKPHIGTDILQSVINRLTELIKLKGGEIKTDTRVESLILKQGKIAGVKTGGDIFDTDVFIAATGHSARDTWKMLKKNGVLIEPKPFQLGIRVEHPQSWLDQQQYGEGAGHPALGAADYKLTSRIAKRPVFSFCMCPGGKTIPTVNKNGHLCVNGMSLHKRDSKFASSGIVATVNPDDFGATDLDSCINFVESIESRAFKAGGSDYTAPAQTLQNFLNDKIDISFPETSYDLGLKPALLTTILPPFISTSIKKAALDFNRRLPGFLQEKAVAIAPEARASSPVRIVRDSKTRESSLPGLYPVGEGSGYAGGIMSAALDGLNTATVIMAKYAPLK